VDNREDRDKFPVGWSDAGATRAGVLLFFLLGRCSVMAVGSSRVATAVPGPPLFVLLQIHPDVTRQCTGQWCLKDGK